MARTPKDYAGELAKLKAREAELRNRQVAELGRLVVATGAADALDLHTLAGVLLSAVADAKAGTLTARYAELGEVHFQAKRRTPGKAAPGGTRTGAE